LLGNLAASSSLINGMNDGSNFGFDTTNAAGGTFTIADVIADTTGASGGARGLTKLGINTLVLTNANTYTGPTTVNAGTLRIDAGSLASGSVVSVALGATLSGTGTIGGATTIGGTHSPGNSPGIQIFGDDLAYEVGSNVVWELISNDVGTRGTNFDGINVGGVLSFDATTTLDLTFNAGSTVDWTDGFWANDYLGTDGWLIYSGATSLTTMDNLSLNAPASWLDFGSASLNSVRSNATFLLHQEGNDIFLNYVAVPEPSTALLGGLGLLGLLAYRRHSRG
jgi:autotransporter-associated beta strand protein